MCWNICMSEKIYFTGTGIFKDGSSLYLTCGERSTSNTYLPFWDLLIIAEDPEDLRHVFKGRELDLGKVFGPWSFYQTGASDRWEGRGFDHNPLRGRHMGQTLGKWYILTAVINLFFSPHLFLLWFSPQLLWPLLCSGFFSVLEITHRSIRVSESKGWACQANRKPLNENYLFSLKMHILYPYGLKKKGPGSEKKMIFTQGALGGGSSHRKSSVFTLRDWEAPSSNWATCELFSHLGSPLIFSTAPGRWV